MKNLIKKFIWWLVSPILPLLILTSCLNQKKNVENSVKENSTQKNEVISDKSENKSEQETTQNSSVKISDSTIIFNSKSELLEYIKKNYDSIKEDANNLLRLASKKPELFDDSKELLMMWHDNYMKEIKSGS